MSGDYKQQTQCKKPGSVSYIYTCEPSAVISALLKAAFSCSHLVCKTPALH